MLVSDSDKVEALNAYFSSVGDESREDCFDEPHRRDVEAFISSHQSYFSTGEGEGTPECDSIREDEVSSSLNSLKPRKACGPDGIHPLMLINGGPMISRSLTFLFSLSWELGYLPEG